MTELVAQGPRPEEHWRQPLVVGQVRTLGRNRADWTAPWEPFLSRRHAELTWKGGRLHVRRLPSARNPLCFKGQNADLFQLHPGEHFVVGETTFLVSTHSESRPGSEGPLLQERVIGAQDLQRIAFRNVPHHLDVLSKLPEVISGAANDPELFVRLVNMLLAGIRRADAVALVEGRDARPDQPPYQFLHWDRRRETEGSFRPSHRLVSEALRQRQTVLHVRRPSDETGSEPYTTAGNFDWSFCTPVPGEATRNWAICVSGRLVTADVTATLLAPWETNELGEHVKFTELVASILSSLRQVQLLQRRQATLGQFFSPAVLRTLSGTDPERLLQPRETEVSVLFCDLRGFSREAEKANKLEDLLERVSRALSGMTQNILDQAGVIGDFQGDAAMGFWGWPVSQPDRVQRACMAALGIRTLFEAASQVEGHPLAGFRVGIGIATGAAVAGKIGAADQAKVGVFGPVVNLASRLEGMTKSLRTPILLDENTARVVDQIPPAVARFRPIARVLPFGLETPLMVSELLAPVSDFPLLTDEHLVLYREALEAFQRGQWTKAHELLHRLPAQDRGKDFLLHYILEKHHTPPPNWDGVIRLRSKD